MSPLLSAHHPLPFVDTTSLPPSRLVQAHGMKSPACRPPSADNSYLCTLLRSPPHQHRFPSHHKYHRSVDFHMCSVGRGVLHLHLWGCGSDLAAVAVEPPSIGFHRYDTVRVPTWYRRVEVPAWLSFTVRRTSTDQIITPCSSVLYAQPRLSAVVVRDVQPAPCGPTATIPSSEVLSCRCQGGYAA